MSRRTTYVLLAVAAVGVLVGGVVAGVMSSSTSTTRRAATTTTIPPTSTTLPASSACLARSSVKVLSGAQARVDGSPFHFATNGAINARRAYWNGAHSYQLLLRDAGPHRRPKPCLVGGFITTPYPDSDPWTAWHGRAGIGVDEAGSQIIGTTVSKEGDGIQLTENASNWSVVGVHLSDIHDDCIEDDGMQGGLVADSLFDGCYDFFSAQGFSGYTFDGSGRNVTIEDSLVRLGDFASVSQGVSPGHAFFFKWGQDPPGLQPSNTTGHAPDLTIKNTIFMADSNTAISGHQGIGMPQWQDASGVWHDYLTSCSNNTMVWLGPGPYPGHLPSCFHVTTDRSVWTDAVAAWLAAHHTAQAQPPMTR
jgi:hypothetical protein